jgi:hypothetical protein
MAAVSALWRGFDSAAAAVVSDRPHSGRRPSRPDRVVRRKVVQDEVDDAVAVHVGTSSHQPVGVGELARRLQAT